MIFICMQHSDLWEDVRTALDVESSEQLISLPYLHKCSLLSNIKAVFSSKHYGSFKSPPIAL